MLRKWNLYYDIINTIKFLMKRTKSRETSLNDRQARHFLNTRENIFPYSDNRVMMYLRI